MSASGQSAECIESPGSAQPHRLTPVPVPLLTPQATFHTATSGIILNWWKTNVKAQVLSETHKALHDLPHPLSALTCSLSPLTHSAPVTQASLLFP